MQLRNLVSVALLAPAALAANTKNLTQLISSTPQLSSLGKLLTLYPDVTKSLAKAKDVTLLAPNNKAIAKLEAATTGTFSQDEVQALLDYHVLKGKILSSDLSSVPTFATTTLDNSTYSNVTGGQVVEGATSGKNVVFTSGLKLESLVVKANIKYSGGIVHIIDQVLTIPLNATSTAVEAGLSALVGAASAAGLADTVDALKDVTIFAPSNEAFEAIASGAVNATKKEITALLEYHVIQGAIAYSSSLGNGTVKSLEGSNLTITIEDDAIFVNAARIVIPDILIAGGVMHVIDSVLNPSDPKAKPKPNAASPVVQFSGVKSGTLGAITASVPPPATTIKALESTITDVAKGYPTKAKSNAIGTQAGGTKTPGSGGAKTSSGIAAVQTGMVGAAALFGAGAMVANW